MPTLSEIRTLLSRYSGAGNNFTDRLNLVRARLIQSGNWRGTKQQITLSVYSDADGNSIVTLPRQFKTILAGALRSANVLCTGAPLGVRNSLDEFSKNGLGYGGLTRDFVEVTGRYSVYQEWSTPMRIRLKFEQSESAGFIYLSGTLAGEDIWALNSAVWEKREAIAIVGTTTVTSVKYYDAYQFAAKKPVTNGRVTAYALDDAGTETPVAVWEPSETLPRWKRYKVPACEDVSPLSSSIPVTVTQFYTKSELDALFSGTGTITVSAAGTHDLVYAAYFQRWLKIIAQAGSGAYVHNFTLDNATVKLGGVLRISLEVAASSNPTLNFYDNTTGGTLLYTVAGDSSNASYVTLIFDYDGNWHYIGQEV